MKRLVKIILVIIIITRILQQLYFRANIDRSEHTLEFRRLLENTVQNKQKISLKVGCNDTLIYYNDINIDSLAGSSYLSISRVGGGSDKQFFAKKRLIRTTNTFICEVIGSIDVWRLFFTDFRQDLITGISSGFNQMYYSSVSQVVTGLTLGKEGVSGVINSRLYKVTGTHHLLSVSGFHLSFFIVFVAGLYKSIFSKKVVIGLNIVFSFLFVCLVGFSPGLIRAFLMFFLSGIAMYKKRQKRAIYILLVVFLIVTMTDISTFNSIGFQLSYVATFGILLFSFIFNKLSSSVSMLFVGSTRVIKGVFSYFLDSILISLAAQIAIFPLVAYHFKEFSLVGLVATSFVAWTIPIIMRLSFFQIILNSFLPINILFIISLPLFFLVKLFIFILESLSFNWSVIYFDNFKLNYVFSYYLLVLLIYSIIFITKWIFNRKKHAKIYHFYF